MNTLMVQGTTSDAGKSTLVAALCRILSDAGYQVAPFKPQNMALNSAVTQDGGEIGRAQALQAIAAKVPAHSDFNPVLLKPNSDTGAQVILQGRAISNMEAAQYHDYKKVAMDAVLDSHQRLSKNYDYVLVEGAGSPAEINLRQGDIANMGFAEAVDCPVILIADIDKGGVFAHLVGTLALLSESEQARVQGFIINRFRGDMALLQSGLDWLEQRTNKPVLGVLPYMHDLALDAEDAIDNHNVTAQTQARIAVLLLPHTSNHTDFDALRQHPQIELIYVRMEQEIPPCELVIIPGSKNVIFDLQFAYQQNWHQQIKRHVRYGGKVLGICGGMQMLGKYIDDPHQVESSCPHIEGLGLADFGTELAQQKVVQEVTIELDTGVATGYEIHCGHSEGEAFEQALWQVADKAGARNEGFISADKQIIGTYVHGLFDTDAGNQWLLQWLDATQPWQRFDLNEHREQQLTRLAEVFSQHLDMEKISKLLEPTYG